MFKRIGLSYRHGHPDNSHITIIKVSHAYRASGMQYIFHVTLNTSAGERARNDAVVANEYINVLSRNDLFILSCLISWILFYEPRFVIALVGLFWVHSQRNENGGQGNIDIVDTIFFKVH